MFHSKIATDSDEFRNRSEAMQRQIDAWRLISNQLDAAEEAALGKFADRQQLSPRQRISSLLDRKDEGFELELSPLAGYKQYGDRDGSQAGGGLLCGIGTVSAVPCMVIANNSAIKGGAISPPGLEKNLRALQIARENRLPVVWLVESAGANLFYQSEVFIRGGRIFAEQARLSAAGIPQVAVVHGSSTAGGAYIPGLADYTIMVRDRSRVFLAGPPLVSAATGEKATEEELGGASMHARLSGSAEYVADSDEHGIQIARKLIGKIRNANTPLATLTNSFEEPKFPAADLLGVVPSEPRTPYDCREIISRIVDGSDFIDFKKAYDQFTVCAHAEIAGQACGIIGNNGPLTPNGATKAAQFVHLCCQSGLPIIYLQNTTGFMVGKHAEQSGIIKHGAKLIQAVANASVPQITLIVGGSFGAGNYGMCGRALDPAFLFAWPNARVGVMGGEQMAKVLSMVQREKLRRKNQEIDEDRFRQQEEEIIARMQEETLAWFGSARVWDDGIIHPCDTRKVLTAALQICCRRPEARGTSTFGVSRF